jgi:poly(A) polymerase
MRNVMFEKRITKDLLFSTGVEIVETIETAGFHAYFAGGFIRDALLGRKIKDIDIATDAVPDAVEKIFPKTFATGKNFGVINVIHGAFKFEVATFREEGSYGDGRHPDMVKYSLDPRTDAGRRDFTINAMFYSPIKREILDFFGGVGDISLGIIKTVGNPEKRFLEDHLRILRAVRFAAEYDFAMDTNIKEAIRANTSFLKKISAERIRDELEKILLGKNPTKGFLMMDELGISDVILPEFKVMKNVSQNPEFHPEGDVMEHTLAMLSHLVAPSRELAWSVLLHDCGKPSTFSVGEDGKEHFYKHEKEGAKLAEDILKRLKLPSETIKRVSNAIDNHMKMAAAEKMRTAKIARLLYSQDFSLQLELNRIDCISSHRKMHPFVFLLDKYAELISTPVAPPPIVTGKDLINCGLKPGPEFSKILSELYNRQLEDLKLDKEALLNLIKCI